MESLISVFAHIREPHPTTAFKRDQYKTVRVLGKGSFGIVKEVVHLPSNGHFAMKSIRKSLNQDRNAKITAMFQHETSILGQICAAKHENIVELIDYFETKQKYYLIFELAMGGELFERLSKKGKFTERDATFIVFSILSGLETLHQRHIVHRDLKPENILYKSTDDNSKIMIADFGVAELMNDESDMLLSIAGSPSYAAPEVIKRTGHSTQADMWSLGVLTYSILAGYHPFHYCEDIPHLLDSIATAKFKFQSPYWDNISDEAKQFISALMQLDPQKRPTPSEAKRSKWILRNCKDAKMEFKERRRNEIPAQEKIAKPENITISASTQNFYSSSEEQEMQRRDSDKDINLVTCVWHDITKFNARKEWKKALHVIQTISRAKEISASKALLMDDPKDSPSDTEGSESPVSVETLRLEE